MPTAIYGTDYPDTIIGGAAATAGHEQTGGQKTPPAPLPPPSFHRPEFNFWPRGTTFPNAGLVTTHLPTRRS